MRLAIALLTCGRVEYTIRTIKTLYVAGQHQSGDVEFHWYVADASDRPEDHKQVLDVLNNLSEPILGSHSFPMNPGENWTRAYQSIIENNYDHILHLENDWELVNRDIDLLEYMELLEAEKSLGMVRLAHLAKGSRVEVDGFRGLHYLRFHRSTQYAYSGNPGIHHRRLHDFYGFFECSHNAPGDVEVDFDSRFRATPGPDIVWPVDLGGWGAFAHIGEARSK